MDAIRVATLNIWNRGGPWEARLSLIRKELERLAPDVVGLQEVVDLRDSPHADVFNQAELIADALGYAVAYGRSAQSESPLGNAILSRWPIAETAAFDLPSLGTREARCLLFARIRTPFGDLSFFTTHFNWKLHETHVRCSQARFVAEKVMRLNEKGTLPAVLTGDFNADPDSDEMRFLRGLTGLGGEGVFFSDCFHVAGNGGAGVTFARRNPYAAVCHEPDRRIDYIYVTPPDELGRGSPIEASVCFDRCEEGVFASDHFGVFARVKMK